MRISDLIKMGLKNLARRKARTALTVIGVVIGTISIVVMVSIGMGMNASYEAQVMQSGSLTTIDVVANNYDYNEETGKESVQKQVLNDAFITMVKGLDHVEAVTPYIQQQIRVESGKYQNWGSLIAVDMSLIEEFAFPAVEKGEAPSVENKELFLLGGSFCKEFQNPRSFRYEPKELDPARDKMKLYLQNWDYTIMDGKKESYTPIHRYGVMKESGNYEFDYQVYVDISYYNQIFQKYCKTLKPESRKKALRAATSYNQVKISVDSIKNIEEVQDKLDELGYRTSSLKSNNEPMEKASEMLQLVLGCIGGVSMLVSAISIANTMIMSIYERTKEIGVMKVLGCYVRDIKKLFLFESAMIGFLGGAIGIGLSYLASWAINKYGAPIFQALLQSSYMYDMSTNEFSIIPIWLPLIALAFAMLVGVVSGYYPARRATKISAIEAMKTEG